MTSMSLERGLDVMQGRARALTWLLYGYGAVTAAMTLATAAMMTRGEDLGQAGPLSPLAAIDGVLSLAYALIYVACVVATCLWTYRASANLHAAGFEGLKFTPGWAVGWYFVPFAFWVQPFKVMKELWNVSHLLGDPEGSAADSRLTIWWGSWVVSNVILNISMRIGGVSGASNVLDLAGWAISLPAAFMLAQIVRDVTRAQSHEMHAGAVFA